MLCQTNPTCSPCSSNHLIHFIPTGAAGDAGGAGSAGPDRLPPSEEEPVARDPGESNIQTHQPEGSAERS